MTIHYFECECESPDHLLRVVLNPDPIYGPTLYFCRHLNHTWPWYKRIVIAIRYIFGYRSRYGEFSEWSLNPEDADRLKDLLDKYLYSMSELNWMETKYEKTC